MTHDYAGRSPPEPGDDVSPMPRYGTGVLMLGGPLGGLAAARSLGRRGIAVWCIAHDQSIAAFSRYVERFVPWAGPGDPAALEWLERLAADHDLAGWMLLPTGDAEARLVSENVDRLARTFRVRSVAPEVFHALNDKRLLTRHAIDLGIDTARVYEHGEIETVGQRAGLFPLIVKPAKRDIDNLLVRDKAWLMSDEEDFARLYPLARRMAGSDGLLIQAMIPGGGTHQYSYAALWDQGRELASLTARRTRQYPVTFGKSSTCVQTLQVPEIIAPSRLLLESLGYDGLVEIEYKHDARTETWNILDVNTRVWAWLGLCEAADVDLTHMYWQLLAGDPVEAAAMREDVSWVYPVRNAMARISELVQTRSLRGAALRGPFLHDANATLALDDPVPGLVEVPVTGLRILKRLAARIGLAPRSDGVPKALIRDPGPPQPGGSA